MMLVALSSVAFASDSWWSAFEQRAARDGVDALDDGSEASVPPPKQTKPAPPPKQTKPAPMPEEEEEDIESIIASLFELLDLDSEDVDDLVQAIENVDSEDVENLVEELIGGLKVVSDPEHSWSTGDMPISEEAEKDARQGPQVKSPTPEHDTECRTSWDCRGTGVYCYQGYGGMPNYCSRHSGSGQKDGRGSLCTSQSACGWVGKGNRARKMNCHRGKCRDPGPPRAARDADEFEMEARAADFLDLMKEARQGGQVRSPAPKQQCETSWDCKGTGFYCMKGHGGLPNYCDENDGVGSLCTKNADCGWIGKGDYARQMYCAYPPSYGRRLYGFYGEDLEREARQMKSPNPQPPSYKTCQDPGVPPMAREFVQVRDFEKDARQIRSPTPESDTECETSWNCDKEGVYCYEGHGGLPNYCYKGDGVGSLCKNDADCGWIGKGDYAREMKCEWVNSERRRMLPPQQKCVDPYAESSSDSYDGPPVMG